MRGQELELDRGTGVVGQFSEKKLLRQGSMYKMFIEVA